MPLPAHCCRPVQAADKTVKAEGLSLRGRFAPVAISGRQLRFRRSFPVIRAGTARLPRPRWGLAMTRQGNAVVHQCPYAFELACTRRSMSAATDAIGWYVLSLPCTDCKCLPEIATSAYGLLAMTIRGPLPFYRQPVRNVRAVPGAACRSPTTRDRRLCETFHFSFSIFHSPHASLLQFT